MMKFNYRDKMSNQKKEIIKWWSNRKLPANHKELIGVSDLSDKELELLKYLKQQYLFAKEHNINLGWGHPQK